MNQLCPKCGNAVQALAALTAERDALREAVRKLMKACAIDGYACFHHRAHGKPCNVENCPIINAENEQKAKEAV